MEWNGRHKQKWQQQSPTWRQNSQSSSGTHSSLLLLSDMMMYSHHKKLGCWIVLDEDFLPFDDWFVDLGVLEVLTWSIAFDIVVVVVVVVGVQYLVECFSGDWTSVLCGLLCCHWLICHLDFESWCWVCVCTMSTAYWVSSLLWLHLQHWWLCDMTQATWSWWKTELHGLNWWN